MPRFKVKVLVETEYVGEIEAEQEDDCMYRTNEISIPENMIREDVTDFEIDEVEE